MIITLLEWFQEGLTFVLIGLGLAFFGAVIMLMAGPVLFLTGKPLEKVQQSVLRYRSIAWKLWWLMLALILTILVIAFYLETVHTTAEGAGEKKTQGTGQ